MIIKIFRCIMSIVVVAMILAWKPSYSRVASAAPTATVSVSPGLVREGNDFATQVLHDPWDMEQFSDISKNLNESNVVIHLNNPRVANGIFSATSATDAQFFPLFPGYGEIDGGKVGARFPISSSKYHCVYTRMSADKATYMFVFWYKGPPPSTTVGNSTYLAVPANQSRIIYHDLNASTLANPWSSQSSWQGFRIDPVVEAGINFNVDWVRLTDCAAVNTTLSWSGLSGSLEVWAGKGAANPDFLVASGVSAGSGTYTLDVQGWEPGTYYLATKNSQGAFQWTPSPLVIDPAPRVTFTRPSYSSGQSLKWEMNALADIITNVNLTRCVQYSFSGGVMNLITQPPSIIQPQNCKAGEPSDPQIALSILSNPIDTSTYRYLTLRLKTDGPWEDVNHGWMARLLWETNVDGNHCINVSKDISFDTGWDQLVVDLGDPVQGTVEYAATLSGTCPNNRKWTDLPTVNHLRFDPNENLTGAPLYQQIDYIRLSQVDRVARGTSFPIQFTFGGTGNANLSVSTFYTTDRANPKQNAITPLQTSRPNRPYSINIPLVKNGQGDSYFLSWNTTNVAAGRYYICAEANDGLNVALSCSDAPVDVFIP